MTKEQRRKIYEQALWCIGDDNEDFTCWLLLEIYDPYIKTLQCELFPEFMMQRPDGVMHSWWPHTPWGNLQRRIALEKAIALTL